MPFRLTLDRLPHPACFICFSSFCFSLCGSGGVVVVVVLSIFLVVVTSSSSSSSGNSGTINSSSSVGYGVLPVVIIMFLLWGRVGSGRPLLPVLLLLRNFVLKLKFFFAGISFVGAWHLLAHRPPDNLRSYQARRTKWLVSYE